jgi:hypothetical protein
VHTDETRVAGQRHTSWGSSVSAAQATRAGAGGCGEARARWGDAKRRVGCGCVCRLPCRWDAKRIVVLDEVHIEEPYTTDACKGSNAMAVDRVRKVVRP